MKKAAPRAASENNQEKWRSFVRIRQPPYFIIIERALRDEGTSYHYMAASDYSHADAGLMLALDGQVRLTHCATQQIALRGAGGDS